MINLTCGVIRISNKCSYLKVLDQQSNPNLTFLVMISYHLVSEISLELILYQTIVTIIAGNYR